MKTEKNKLTSITENTQIVINIKYFIGIIISILGITYGFYDNVVEPKFEKIEQQYERMISDQKEQNRIFYDKLSDINSAISVLNANINALNKNYTNIQEQTNGTFDSNVTLNNQEIINNNTLAQFEHY